MRKLLSHAFSESALREQEPILTGYFDLLVSRLKAQSQNPDTDKVDMTSWYNFTTFDIIGLVSHRVPCMSLDASSRSILTTAVVISPLETPFAHSRMANITPG